VAVVQEASSGASSVYLVKCPSSF